jgi:hypothetical protein
LLSITDTEQAGIGAPSGVPSYFFSFNNLHSARSGYTEKHPSGIFIPLPLHS